MSKENAETMFVNTKRLETCDKISTELSEEEIDKLVEEHFTKIYGDKSLEELLEEGMKDIEEGRVRPFEDAMADIRKKLGFTT